MAKHSSHILALARRGAQHRYDELKAELDTLVRHFPGLARRALRRGRKPIKGAVSAVDAYMESTPKPRRTLSAAARKKIGDAQRRRWAKQKAKGK
jgi:hypothetical protein